MNQGEKAALLEKPEFPALALDIHDPPPAPHPLPVLHAAARAPPDARGAPFPAAEQEDGQVAHVEPRAGHRGQSGGVHVGRVPVGAIACDDCNLCLEQGGRVCVQPCGGRGLDLGPEERY